MSILDKHVIIGTAGHVDHGKSTLITALTGTNPDRLKEEQERGMTIDLGFAALTLPNGQMVGIVDVPGHERFLKNMLAGAGGVDVVLLVIAADEGIMPQTREHLDILRLLDVKSGVVALTKSDIVDAEWLQLVTDEVRAFLQGTPLEHAPIVAVSAVTGQGLQQLLAALQEAVAHVPNREVNAPFRLPIDRVFTLAGAGTVVTGTLVSGQVRVGDPVEILPPGLQSRARQIQVHGRKVETAVAGSRVAVNLPGVEKEQLARGMVCAPPGVFQPTRAFDAQLSLLPGAAKGLAHRARIRLYLGTAEVIGRVSLLDSEQLEPGQQGFVQLRLDKPLVAARGDRFVIRTYSPMLTIGGGIVLEPHAPRHRRFDPPVVARLQSLLRGNPEQKVLAILAQSPGGMDEAELARRAEMDPANLAAILSQLASQQQAVHIGEVWFARNVWDDLRRRAESALRHYHQQNPLRAGMPREELRSTLGGRLPARLFEAVLMRWQQEGVIVLQGTLVRLAGFAVRLNERQQRLAQRVEQILREAGVTPPPLEVICQQAGAPPDAVRAMIQVLLEQGTLVRLEGDLFFHRETINQLAELVRRTIQEKGSLSVGEFRDLTGSSRKFAVPLLEYFDSVRLTRRVGDVRVLVG
ncbi:MAG: selenocysteine-specific translation elongation factor [Armatimonadota bacterium]|nr:selenocysteine-specific translation elongation factor [bacterium]MDW8322054.1 selenocysteine-specific translation elongation factor [Armatimonadota bacterium]